MTISEVVREAIRHGLSYGEYVQAFDPPKPVKRSVPKDKRVCMICGKGITERGSKAIYCFECAEEVRVRKKREREEKYRQRNKEGIVKGCLRDENR